MRDRDKRLAEMIRQAISQILLEMDYFNQGLFTITNVELTKDLRFAKIFYIVDSTLALKTAGRIENDRKKIKYELSQRVRMRYVPEIKFVFDRGIEKYNDLLAVYKKVEKEKNAEQNN